MSSTYFRHVKIGEKNYIIYASKMDLNKEIGEKIHEEEGYKFFLSEREIKENAIKLPDEQSWSTFFPFYLFLGEKRKILEIMDKILQRLRALNSPVKCFYKGCKNRGKLYIKNESWEAYCTNHYLDESKKE
ncbi:hypothetical protein HRbin06_00567 [archaeon HR06]|nr:hypothetical protein HRbin06_00567 [archaeon HR06]